MIDDPKKSQREETEMEEEKGEKGGEATSDVDFEPDTGMEDYEKEE